MAPESLTVLVAFTAGLLSFLSPCVLPLVPSYVTFITGMGLDDVSRARRTALVHALLFVLGFSFIFVALGAGASVFGQLLREYRVWIARIGGVLMVLMGLWMLDVLRIGALQQERRFHLSDKPLGYLGTVLVGIAFGAGWTPCLGPTLGAILLLAANESELGKGITLLSFYSAGLAVPFLVSALALEKFLSFFQSFRHNIGKVNRIAGILLIVVGVLMFTGLFERLAAVLQPLTPAFLVERL
ncbi:MAG TPA: cytochrome C biogenesis protein CcdA [Gemmatimonas aurantiaca]|uniref:Cytochrome c-type biogenesis protein CcdA n=2 Tax=Gemmatimonas aurantiaca TaxID=173480 RepID=C1A6W2_GEMAT|nr:cytochrome c biogenesis protein CcdA [Gemmatimonas aurantiaca]BAH37972.1 cytochrome c-type biogenesis protein CcdA [Gemmatimonas aurantiaca T-27]HCT56748.1 cytochrome C biogenesis protein CcdA [Gemmatimonas aurantiaca]